MRILSIQSHVVHGYVGNKSAVFPLQLLGIDVSPLNTVQYSNHLGHPRHSGIMFPASHIKDLMEGLIIGGFAEKYDAILTGYVGNSDSLRIIGEQIVKYKSLNEGMRVIVDPVLGDDGKLYCPVDLVAEYQQFIRNADLITPNGFESELLSDLSLSSGISAVMTKLHSMGPKQVVITSVVNLKNEMFLHGSCLIGGAFSIKICHLKQHFTGTGDLFSALLLAYTASLPLKDACLKAVDTMKAVLGKTIELADRNGELAIIESARFILDPPPFSEALDSNS